MSNQDNNTPTSAKKSSGFKRSLMWLLVFGVLGGMGYIAYDRGALDQYLPKMLHAKAEPEAVVQTAAPASPSLESPAPAVAGASGGITQSDLQAALAQQLQKQNPAPTVTSPETTQNTTPNANAPILLAINGAPANALLTAFDAQWQWSNIQQDYALRGDVALALQNLQNLKAQLEASKDPAFAPTLTALAQTETQLQAWTNVPSTTYLTGLQQAITAVDKMDVKGKDDGSNTAMTNLSWWERIIASLKNVIEIKKIDGAKEAQMLSPAMSALVKQSISARLLSAQWAAQTGQWPSAQLHAVAAHELATQWSDPTLLAPIQGLVDNKIFPAAPDFNAVSTALQQARAQLTSAARIQQSASPVTEPVTTPNAPAPKMPVKGGA